MDLNVTYLICYISGKASPIAANRKTNISIDASGLFTKDVNPPLAKRPLKTNGRLANRRFNSLVKEAAVQASNVATNFDHGRDPHLEQDIADRHWDGFICQRAIDSFG